MPQNNRFFAARHTKNMALPGKPAEIAYFRPNPPALLHYGNNGAENIWTTQGYAASCHF
jgi:hypothetical protein